MMINMLMLLMMLGDVQIMVADSSEFFTEEQQCEFLKSECLDCKGLCNGDHLSRVDCTTYCQCSHVQLAPNRTDTCSVVCNEGYFGSRCEHKCSDTCRNRKCSPEGGACSEGCVNGYHGDTCLSSCNQRCRHRICDRDTGRCSSHCDDGYYGSWCGSKCPRNCDVCSLVNNSLVCLIEEIQRGPCFPYEVILSCLGAIVVLMILVYFFYRCSKFWSSCQHDAQQEAQVGTGSPLNLSQFALECHTPRKTVQQLSRSTSYLDEPYHEISSYTPTRTRLALRTFRFPSTNRRSKSLCSLGNGPACWVGEGEDLFDLFENTPKVDVNAPQIDDVEDSQMLAVGQIDDSKIYDVETRKSQQVKSLQTDDSKVPHSQGAQGPEVLLVGEPQDDEVFVDAPADVGACSSHLTESSTEEAATGCLRSTWKREARKGYISAIYKNDVMSG